MQPVAARPLSTPKEPRRPSIGPYVAVLLELAMLATFAFERSWIGVVLWIAYSWFSATWQALFSHFRDEG